MTQVYPWWYERKDDLLAFAEERCPCLVYNEETLNDTLFDLLCINEAERVFYPVRANPHPTILEKAHSMGAGFTCLSGLEMDRLFKFLPDLSPNRILLIPDFNREETLDRDFNSGVSVVVKSFDALGARAHMLKGRDILLWFSLKVGGERDADQREGLKPEMSLGDMDVILERAEKLEASVVGIYTSLENPDWTSFRVAEFFSQWDGPWSHLERDSVFVLAGVPLGNGFEGVDVPATTENVEALQDRYPEAAIWLDPGFSIVFDSGVLLVRAGKTNPHRDGLVIGMDSRKEIVIPLVGKGPHHQVFNLSHLHAQAPGRNGLGSRNGTRGMVTFQEGDIILMTNMGAPDMYPQGSASLRKIVSEHYMRARRICRVKI